MKIGLSARYFVDDQSQDGIANYTRDLYNGLIAEGHEVKLIHFLPESSLINPKKISSLFKNSYLPCSLASLLPNFIDPYKKLEQQIDVFHATDHRVPCLKTVPVICSVHDSFVFTHPEWSKQEMREIKNYFLKKMIRSSSHIIAISNTVAEDLVNNLQISRDKMSVVYQGIRQEWFTLIPDQTKQSILDKHHLKPGFLLFVSTIQPRKNLARVIKAFLQLPQQMQQRCPLVICGKLGWGEDKITEEITELCQQTPSRWITTIANNELQALYQSATALIYPSLAEGFGRPIVEAFASQLPVITSNISSMPEVAGDAAILIDPYNTEEIRQAMQNIIEQPATRQQLITAGNHRASLFTLNNFVKNTVAVYNNE